MQGQLIINEYDIIGSIIKQAVKVDGSYYEIKRYGYDFRGQLIAEAVLVEAEDIHTDYLIGARYDNEYPNRIVCETTYQYYGNGKLKSKTDAAGNKTTYEYNLDASLVRNIDAV